MGVPSIDRLPYFLFDPPNLLLDLSLMIVITILDFPLIISSFFKKILDFSKKIIIIKL